MTKTADFARRAGVTVRTLHYYDRVGLLRPRRTPAGHRVYDDDDLVRLQQIRMLQFVGLSLEQIQRVLQSPWEAGASLRMQLDLLRQKQAQLDRVIRILSDAEEGPLDLETLSRNIEKETKMDWVKQFYDEDTWKKLEERAVAYPPDQAARDQQRWEDLFAEARASMGEPLDSPHMRALAERFVGLVDEFTGGDARILEGLRKMHAAGTPPGMQSNQDVKERLAQAMRVAGLAFRG